MRSLILCLLLAASGCATVVSKVGTVVVGGPTHAVDADARGVPYAGVRLWATSLGSGPWWIPVALVDVPLCLVADTACLPFDLCYQDSVPPPAELAGPESAGGS
ncbi:MAG: hypothetical protein R3F62_14085 [Planctomycetota bacterium]